MLADSDQESRDTDPSGVPAHTGPLRPPFSLRACGWIAPLSGRDNGRPEGEPYSRRPSSAGLLQQTQLSLVLMGY